MPEPTVSAELTCPQCRAIVSPESVICGNCGTNIVLVTLMAGEDWGRANSGAPQVVLTMEQLVPRLGDYLLKQGHITDAQLQAALAHQQAHRDKHERQLLGQALIETGALTRETLDRVIAERVLQLQSALLEANRDLEQRVAKRTAELEAALVKLTELNQLKANFVANISHELRTPLAQIKGYNAILADGTLGALSGEQLDAVHVMARASDRLERLINDLIAYAATAKGQLTLSLRPISIIDLTRRVVERSAQKAARQQVTLTTLLPEALPAIPADEEKLYWTILQLVDNAIKFTPSGGQVTVSARAQGQRLHLAVQDTGIGIPAQRLNEIFEPFQQLDGSATRRYGGTGLGLALVKKIVEAHGSTIVIESEEGQGSRFAFSLPLITPN